MVVIVDRAYLGAAASTIINTAMTATTPDVGGTITVVDDSGYPSSGKFEITVDRGLPNQEHVVISSRSGTTFTIGQRGYDGSVASAHSSGEATCEHYLSGRTTQLFVDHVDDVESDPHSTKLLNNSRHDQEARHTFGGGAYGTPVTPSAVSTTPAAGTGNNPSREDHVHELGAGSIDSSSFFAAGVVDAAAIGTDAVGSAEIAANAVTSSEVADNAVDILAIDSTARGILSPAGSITAFGGTAAPTGWLLCQGQAVSRTTFATLFGVISTTYGAGDGSTTFNVPNLQQRFPLGKATSGTGATLGGTGGSIDHVHNLDTSSSQADFTVIGTSPQVKMRRKSASSWNSTITADMTGATSDVVASTTALGLSGDTDADNPPFQVVNFIIRTGNTT